MFEPGQIVTSFESKKGTRVEVRYPQQSDLPHLLEFINKLVEEDTFILLNQKQSEEDEREYLVKVIEEVRDGNTIQFHSFVDGKLIANCAVNRGQWRSHHVGTVGISIAQGYRDEGIGRKLLELLIQHAKQVGFQVLIIRVFANNARAHTLYQKVGFVEHGRVPKAVRYKGEFIDEIELHMLL